MASTPPEYAGMPGWVKIFLGALVVLLLIGGIAGLIGGSEHGPGRHLPSGVRYDPPADPGAFFQAHESLAPPRSAPFHPGPWEGPA